MRIHLAMFAVLLLGAAHSVRADIVDDELISVYPSAPHSTDLVRIMVPAHGCYMSGGAAGIFTPQVARTGNDITITVVEDYNRSICFAAGDPYVSFPVWVPVGTLPAGNYTLTYRRFGGWDSTPTGMPNRQINSGFAVLAGGNANVIPTASPIGLALIALLMVGIAWLNRHRMQ
jgi:hypothetical protein